MTEDNQWQDDWPNGWWPNCSDGFSDIEARVDSNEVRVDKPSTYLKSARKDFEVADCPKLTNSRDAGNLRGSRVAMKGWVKSNLLQGSAHLWIRVDGDWTHDPPLAKHFDNMIQRPITGRTEWTEYELVVDVPASSTTIVYGTFLRGLGEIWLDEVTVQATESDRPLTGYDWSQQPNL